MKLLNEIGLLTKSSKNRIRNKTSKRPYCTYVKIRLRFFISRSYFFQHTPYLFTFLNYELWKQKIKWFGLKLKIHNEIDETRTLQTRYLKILGKHKISKYEAKYKKWWNAFRICINQTKTRSRLVAYIIVKNL